MSKSVPIDSTPQKLILSTVTAFVVSLIFHQQYKKHKTRSRLSQLAKTAVLNRDRKIHACLSTSVSVTDTSCFNNSACEIVSAIHRGDLSARELILVLAKRCVLYGRRNVTNVITEEFYDEAYAAAEIIEGNKKSKDDVDDDDDNKKVLLGVPISVKDCIGLKGAFQTGGLQCRTDEKYRSTEDSLIVQVLRSAGALPCVRGNVSQIMMLPESVNNIWGCSLNPWDLSRTPGGSSGGEGALVAMKCVPLAIGSDIGGSIRIPAAFCGVVGFKPTPNRLSMKGCMKPRKNDRFGMTTIIPVVCGPITRTVEDCALFMKAACVPEMFDNDTQVAPLPFLDELYQAPMTKKLRIGYFVSDGWFEPCQAQKRAMHATIQTLEAAGHVCVPFDPPTNGWSTYMLYVAINGAEGNMRGFIDAVEGELLIPAYRTLYAASNLPNWLRPVVSLFLDKRRSALLESVRCGGISVHDFWQRCADLVELRKLWDDTYKDANLDAVIHSALPLPAFPHGLSGDLTAAFSYTMLSNLLLWPSGVVPVSVVKEDEQHYDMRDVPSEQRDAFAKLAGKVMEGSKGLPLSVAVLTRGFQDEQCLRVMKLIEGLMQFGFEPNAYKSI